MHKRMYPQRMLAKVSLSTIASGVSLLSRHATAAKYLCESGCLDQPFPFVARSSRSWNQKKPHRAVWFHLNIF